MTSAAVSTKFLTAHSLYVLNHAKPDPFDICYVLLPDEKIQFNLVEEGDNVYFDISFPESVQLPATQVVRT